MGLKRGVTRKSFKESGKSALLLFFIMRRLSIELNKSYRRSGWQYFSVDDKELRLITQQEILGLTLIIKGTEGFGGKYPVKKDVPFKVKLEHHSGYFHFKYQPIKTNIKLEVDFLTEKEKLIDTSNIQKFEEFILTKEVPIAIGRVKKHEKLKFLKVQINKKKRKMNNSKSDEKKLLYPVYNKAEIIIFLQKAQRDFNMIDSRIKEMLNVENINIEEFRDVAPKVYELGYELNECTETRNKKIEELLEIIKGGF